MKPPPPLTLLPPGHEWRVIVASDWHPLTGWQCVAASGEGDWRRCGEPSVATCETTDIGTQSRHAHGETRCADHIGSIRWVDGDRVMQWRAVRVGVTTNERG